MGDFQVVRNGVALQFQEEPEGGYTVSVSELPGCVSYGTTFEEGILEKNILYS